MSPDSDVGYAFRLSYIIRGAPLCWRIIITNCSTKQLAVLFPCPGIAYLYNITEIIHGTIQFRKPVFPDKPYRSITKKQKKHLGRIYHLSTIKRPRPFSLATIQEQ